MLTNLIRLLKKNTNTMIDDLKKLNEAMAAQMQATWDVVDALSAAQKVMKQKDILEHTMLHQSAYELYSMMDSIKDDARCTTLTTKHYEALLPNKYSDGVKNISSWVEKIKKENIKPKQLRNMLVPSTKQNKKTANKIPKWSSQLLILANAIKGMDDVTKSKVIKQINDFAK